MRISVFGLGGVIRTFRASWNSALALSLLLIAFGASAQSTLYEYDALDRLTRVVHSSGESVEYVDDPAGNIVSRMMVPEPSSGGMLFAGLGLLRVFACRRRNVAGETKIASSHRRMARRLGAAQASLLGKRID